MKTSLLPEMPIHTSAAKLVGAMKACGMANPEDKLRQLVEDGELIPFCVDFPDGDRRIGLARMKRRDYLALKNVQAESVYFDNDDISKLGLVTHSPSTEKLEELRSGFIKRFTIAQQRHHPRKWCSFSEIADWCAREKGGSLRNEDRRKAALQDLKSALQADRFNETGRSKVLCLSPDIGSADAREPTQLDAKYVRDLLEWFSDDDDLISLVLVHCWIPAALCRQWFIAQSIVPPIDWFSPADSEPQPPRRRGGQRDTAPAPDATQVGRQIGHDGRSDVLAHWPVTTDPPEATPKKRKSNGRDYRQVDAELVTEMHELIQAGRASSPEDAARALVARAVGRGSDGSRAVQRSCLGLVSPKCNTLMQTAVG